MGLDCGWFEGPFAPVDKQISLLLAGAGIVLTDACNTIFVAYLGKERKMKKLVIVALVSVIATAVFADPLAEIDFEVFVNIQAAATLTLNGDPRLELVPMTGSATDYEGWLDPASAPILIANVPVTVSAALVIADPFGALIAPDLADWSVRVLGASDWTPANIGPSVANYDTVVTEGGYPVTVGVRVTGSNMMNAGVEGETPVASVIMTVAPRP